MPEFAALYKIHNGEDKLQFRSGCMVERSDGRMEDDCCNKVYKRLNNMYRSNQGKGNQHTLGPSSEHPMQDRLLRFMVDKVTEVYKRVARAKISRGMADDWYEEAKEMKNAHNKRKKRK